MRATPENMASQFVAAFGMGTGVQDVLISMFHEVVEAEREAMIRAIYDVPVMIGSAYMMRLAIIDAIRTRCAKRIDIDHEDI